MTSGEPNGSGLSVLLGTITLLAVGGTVDPASSTFFENHWPTCAYVGAVATVLYVALAFADGRPAPTSKAIVSQSVVTFLVTAGLPMVGESWWPSQPKPGIYFVEAVGGGMFTYLLISSINEAVRAAQKDGTLGRFAVRFIRGWGKRLAGPFDAGQATADDRLYTPRQTFHQTTTTTDTRETSNVFRPVPVRPDSDSIRPLAPDPVAARIHPDTGVGDGGGGDGGGRVRDRRADDSPSPRPDPTPEPGGRNSGDGRRSSGGEIGTQGGE